MNDIEVALPTISKSAEHYHSFANPRSQNFSFRWPIIKYILKNPTGNAWQKLIKTCKYFFAQNPLYPVEELIMTHHQDSGWVADEEELDLNKPIPNIWAFHRFECLNELAEPNAVSHFISKVYKCHLQNLRICDQTLTWNDYKFLTSSRVFDELCFYQCSFKYCDGTDVPLDKLLENLQSIKCFVLYRKLESKTFEKDTVKKITEILSGFNDMNYFSLSDLDETFDLSFFMDFLLKNENISVRLEYTSNLQFSDEYKQILENCFKQIVTKQPKKIPDISIFGFEGLQYKEYTELWSCENSDEMQLGWVEQSSANETEDGTE